MKFFCLLLVILTSGNLSAQRPQVFALNTYSMNGEYYHGLISVSDIYAVSEHPDSAAIPNISSYTVSEARHIILEGKYEERFFAGTGISRSDKVFIYDYSTGKLISLNVSDLEVVAHINPYFGEDDVPHPTDYMYGFAVNSDQLHGLSDHYSESLVYIGEENPFVKGGIQPVSWKKVTAQKGIVRLTNAYNENQILDYTLGEKYESESADFLITVRNANYHSISARILTIESKETGEIVTQRVFQESEGASLVELNNNEPDERTGNNQWFGKLFKDMPPVIFGFEYLSFGCPSLIIAEKSVEDIYINCDNRH